MKSATLIFIFILLAIPFHPASAKNLSKIAIMVTAQEVDGANDIEAAIIEATAAGSRPGVVILDGQNGAFVFTDADRSLNIFVSNLILRGINDAVIENCDDGLFFDDFPLQNIVVENISFFCTGDGVEATGTFQDVTLRDNVFWARNNGIGASGHSSGWLIAGNSIHADGDAINLAGASGVTIEKNHLSGYNGLVFLRDSHFQVRHNTIQATHHGIFIGQESWENTIQGNTLFGMNYAGIILEPGVIGNQLIANRIICAPETACQAVYALPDVARANKIVGNKP